MTSEENNETPKEPCWNALELTCEDYWTWDKDDHSHEVILTGKNSRVARFHPNWSSSTAGARGTRILNGGRYYWELQLSRRIFGTSMMFGIGTRKASLHGDTFVNLLGIDNHSWGLSHKGLIWHNGNWSYYTKPFRENVTTRIGVLFDGITGTLTFYKDGQCLGVAFRGLNEIKEPLFPMISSTAAKTQMVLENMRRDFVNLQDRCRAVIVKTLRCKQDVKELFLPPRIQAFISEVIEDNLEQSEDVTKDSGFLEPNFSVPVPFISERV
ncbi:SPRY domain-containing SOCS box protein 3 [Anthonomus grandis grandis]|uniref:SPRY domain-containing SOCS box protein 3 n=1 Tax=Anthonomus grandis grandis TaxID=2921223 RepID=UPI002165F35A|nr:SPRY domain-containing SOCS box protein 3 [Anthonomus grandis grandis]